jgi:predicted ester cyclase
MASWRGSWPCMICCARVSYDGAQRGAGRVGKYPAGHLRCRRRAHGWASALRCRGQGEQGLPRARRAWPENVAESRNRANRTVLLLLFCVPLVFLSFVAAGLDASPDDDASTTSGPFYSPFGPTYIYKCNEYGECVREERPRFTNGRWCTTDGRCSDDFAKAKESRLSATRHELKDKVLRMMFEILSGNDFTRAEEFISQSHVLISPMLSRPLIGHAGLQTYTQLTRNSFSDYSFFVDDLIQEGTKVVARYQFFGTNTGDYQGLPATGRFVRVSDCLAVFDFWEGKIQQTLIVWPEHHLIDQLSSSKIINDSPLPPLNQVPQN